jgi:hypothetical protein
MVMTTVMGANGGANGFEDVLSQTLLVNADLGLISKPALRAFAAAKLYLTGAAPTQAIAAAMTGSCIPSVKAMITLIEDGDQKLIRSALRGHVPLLETAKEVEPVVKLVAAYHAAKGHPGHLARFANAVGVGSIWDDAIAPVL